MKTVTGMSAGSMKIYYFVSDGANVHDMGNVLACLSNFVNGNSLSFLLLFFLFLYIVATPSVRFFLFRCGAVPPFGTDLAFSGP